MPKPTLRAVSFAERAGPSVLHDTPTLRGAFVENITRRNDHIKKAPAPVSFSQSRHELRLPYIESESLTEGKASLVGGLFYIGAFVGAGALTAAGGILASPIVAGVLTGSVAGLAGLALSKLISDRQVKWMQSQLERGGLLLWARTWTEEREREAISVMQRNGGHDVHVHAVMT